jgi:hypothetical protein
VRRLVLSTSRHFQLAASAEPCGSRVAVRWSVTSSPSGSRCGSSLELEPTDQGAARSVFDCSAPPLRPDTQRRLEDSRAVLRTAGVPTIGLGFYPIFSWLLFAWRSVRSVVCSAGKSGGDEETRTPDPLLAKEMLFQLSYVPLYFDSEAWNGGRFWTRTRDLCLIRAVL